MKAHELGQQGEAFAEHFLKTSGYEIMERNYRSLYGEIDLIGRENGEVCFIEVKTRQEDGWDAFEAVDPRKQRRIARTATAFLMERFGSDEVYARFDVLAVWAAEDGSLKGELLKDAFRLS